MAVRDYYLAEQPIPIGFQIYEERLEVAGVGHRRDDAADFVKRAHRGWLEFWREADNPHDANAIKINGCWKGWLFVNRCHVGYVPRDVARRMVSSRLLRQLRPRLLKTYVGDQGYVEILFQVIGPKDRIEAYRKA